MSKMVKKWLLMLVSIVALAILAAGCGSSTSNTASSQDTSLKGKKIVIGIGTYAPFFYQDASGKNIGFDLDLIDAISKKVGFTYELKVMEFDPLFISVQGGQVDMAAGQVCITEERKKKMSFTAPYYYAGLRAVVRKDSSITSQDELHGKTIAVEKGAAAHAYTSKTYPDSEIIAFPQQSAAYMEVEKGTAHATIYDTPNVAYYLKTHPESQLKVVGTEVEKVPSGFAFPKNSKYVAEIDKALKELQDDGTIDALQKKWINLDVSGGTKSP